ncbi:hypothetical protein CCAX7_61200 [Capsulimonas corticalis]|uniref:Uncharacterized protein n=1 Tax=Capsulimonas corticalis TaxID=2219043 RepID=A0A402CW86_9BACT|nr:TIGR00341 family protein [Capsulimonas corticalis]BDI34069.1 hypothetical protein CCAX7_61200 [Capsulimonas corticalis]
MTPPTSPPIDDGAERNDDQKNVRVEVREQIEANSGLSGAFLLMNGLAAVIASYGLLQDSGAVVIGAMIIAMLLGPITGLALALVDGKQALFRKAILAECCGALLVLAIGFTIGKIHSDLPLGREITARTAPNILDMIIALAGGAAGAYAVLSPRMSGSLVGVAVATALVPPLCTCGICLAHGLYQASGGAFVLFLTNLVAIQSVTSLVLWIQGYHSLSHLDRKAVVRRFGPSVALLVILAGFLIHSFRLALEQQTLHTAAERFLRARIEKNGAARLTDLRIQGYGDRPQLTAVVSAPWVVTPNSCADLEAQLRRTTGRQDLSLRVRTIITRECSSKGYLWTTDPQGAVASSGTQ